MNASFIFCFCIEAIWCNSWVQVTPFDLHHHRHNLVARLPGAILAAPFVLWTKLKKYNLCTSFVSKFFKNPFASCKNDFVEMQNWPLKKKKQPKPGWLLHHFLTFVMKKLKIALLRFEDGVPQVKIVKKVAFKFNSQYLVRFWCCGQNGMYL